MVVIMKQSFTQNPVGGPMSEGLCDVAQGYVPEGVKSL